MHPILKGLIARVASLLPSAIATLLASRLILRHYDIGVFNAYTLVFTTMVLIPLNDLGAGAALTSAIATDGSDHPHTRQVALTASRVMAGSGLSLVVGALVLSALGLWHAVLGDGAFATGAFGFAIAAYGLSFVPGLGQSALLGANKNDLTILVQAFLAPAMCAGAALTVAFHLDAKWVIVVPGVAVLVISLVNAWVSARVTGVRLLPLLPKLPFLHRHPGAKIRGIAGPALIISLTAPITLQSDRLVLSHFSTPSAVADYSVTVQIFAPLVALIAAGARPLWPMYAQARATGTKPMSVAKVITLFVALAAVASSVLFVIAGPLAKAIGGNEIHLGIALPLAMAIAVCIQAAAVPLSMVLMYPAGLRLVATLSLICTPINVFISILVAPSLGAPGPLYVSIGVATFLQVIPGMVHLRRHPVESTPGDLVGMAFVPIDEEHTVLVDGDSRPGLEAPPAPEDLVVGPAPAAPAAGSPSRAVLEPMVADAVQRALANPLIDLQIDRTVLAGPASTTLDHAHLLATRVDRQSERLEAVADQIEVLEAAVGSVTAAAKALAAQRRDVDPLPGTWQAVQRGDEEVRRALEQLIHEERRRRSRPPR